MTGGVNLIGSNQRGDIYLTIFTDKEVHSWPLESPRPAEVEEAYKLVATGQALIERVETASAGRVKVQEEHQVGSISQEIARLGQLLEKGLLSKDEFDQAKIRILRGDS